MRNLRYLRLGDSQIPLEDFLDEKLFPHLVECQQSLEDIVLLTTYTRAEWPQVPSSRFPRSMKVIRFKDCNTWGNDDDIQTIYCVFWQLLQALHNQFGSDYDHGMVEFHGHAEDIYDWEEIISKLSDGDTGLGEAVRRRLIVFEDDVEIQKLVLSPQSPLRPFPS